MTRFTNQTAAMDCLREANDQPREYRTKGTREPQTTWRQPPSAVLRRQASLGGSAEDVELRSTRQSRAAIST
jgi:hypothetical protein